MKRSSASFWITAGFCCVSFLLFGWYTIQSESPSRGIASSPEENVLRQFSNLNLRLQGLQPKDDMTCNCQFGADSNVLNFEDPEVCGEDRNYLDKSMKAMKAIDPNGYYTSARDYSKTASLFPRKCVLYTMRRTPRDRARTAEERRNEDIEFNRTAPPDKQRPIKDVSEYTPDGHPYAKCASNSSGVPERYPHKPCVTESYVNLVYNAMIDVADCMGVPPKFMAPKLSLESGFHPNALGPTNDGGIGQFTYYALLDVRKNYDSHKGRILNSNKESCVRLRSIPGAVPKKSSEIEYENEKLCHSIGVPPNPLRALIYYAIYYEASKTYSNNAYDLKVDPKQKEGDPPFKGVEVLMKEAGISNFDQEKIREMLFVMGYNVGPGRSASIYREWLKYRIEEQKKCQSVKPCPIVKADFDMNYWPPTALRKTKRGEERKKAVYASKNGVPLTFAEYIFTEKDNLYLALVKGQARNLDQGLGAGTCTESKFLEL